jgi:glycosyltransferase involved in cell wall biosynthesis
MKTRAPNYPRVCILLSTYNGERFVAELLGSLLDQTYTNIHIHIRDDGSTDNTVNIISSYAKAHDNILITTGANCGIVHSFAKLLKDTDNPSGLFAFCDQDDIWLPDKVERAVSAIMGSHDPAKSLYCTRLEYVDEELTHLNYSRIPNHIGFNNAVVENIAVGCTSVFGDDIRQLILRANPDNMIMHDWWAYLVASSFGQIIYDSQPRIRYRQHSDSATPWEPGLRKVKTRAFSLIGRLINNKHSGLDSLNQAKYFSNTYKDKPSGHSVIISRLIDLRKNSTLLERMKYIIKPQVARNDPIENLLLKFLVLFNLQ